MRSAPAAVALEVHSAIRATLPSRSPTVVFSWPSATRTTTGSLPVRTGPGRRSLFRRRRCRRCTPPRPGRRRPVDGARCCRAAAGDRRARGPAATPRPRRRPRRSPGGRAPRRSAGSTEGCSSCSRRSLPGEARRPFHDLLVEAAGLLRHDHVLLEGVAQRDHLLGHRCRPSGIRPAAGTGDRLLEVHERIVQGLAPAACGLEGGGQIARLVHRRTLRVGCGRTQTAGRRGGAVPEGPSPRSIPVPAECPGGCAILRLP